MGWTYTRKEKGMSIDKFFDVELADSNIKFVGKGYFCNFHEYYRACYNAKKNTYFCFVALIDTKGDRDYNFGYKDMSEDMGPYIYNCPERILKIVERSAPCGEYAAEWRKKCHAVIEHKKTHKVEVGHTIKFKNAFSFMGGDVKEDTFLTINNPNTRRNTITLRSVNHGFLANIPGWKKYEFEIVE